MANATQSGLLVLSDQELHKRCTELNIQSSGSREDMIHKLEEYSKEVDEFKDARDDTMMRMNNMTGEFRNNDIRFDDIKSCLNTFSGDKYSDIHQWMLHFERQCAIYGLNDIQKFTFAHRLFVGTAKLFVNFESQAISWFDLKSELFNEFGAKADSITIHERMRQRKKTKNESSIEYMYAMMAIASQGTIDEASIVRYVIDGLPGNATSKLFMYEARTISALKVKLQTYDYACLKFESAPDGKHTHTKRSDNVQQQKKMRCHVCGSDAHLRNDCPDKNKGPKCFSCNEFGHISSACSKKDIVPKVNVLRREHNVYLNVIVNGVILNALFDTGSDISAVREDIARSKGIEFSKYFQPIRGIGGNTGTKGKFSAVIEICDDKFESDCHIVSRETIDAEMIVGLDIISQGNLSVGRDGVTFRKLIDTSLDDKNNDSYEDDLNKIMYLSTEEKNMPDLGHISDKVIIQRINAMISNYEPKPINKSPIELEITLKDDIPVYSTPRRLPLCERNEVDRQVNLWLNDGIIRPSNSDFASRVVLASKKDSTKRLCIDYRALNKKIIRDRYPLPNIEDQLDKLQEGKIFSTLDLTNGFFHVFVKENSRKYTSFVTQSGQYEFLRVPFGLCVSPPVFQRFINTIFRPLMEKNYVLTYMDDLIVIADNVEQAIERLQMVLDLAASYNLQIKWQKCSFLQSKITFLGHQIENGHIQPSPLKTQDVQRFPEPKNVKEIQRFLGLVGYFRKFIEGFAAIAKPLSDLLRNGALFKFGDEQRLAFELLKKKICDKPILMIFRQNAETQVHTDASKDAYGAILFQRCFEDGQFHPVYYMSKKTSEAESKLHSYELEVIAVVRAVEKFRIYLLGNPFVVVTDCKAFATTMDKKDTIPKIARWAMTLQEYEFEVQHRAGTSMQHVDALSRMYFIEVPSVRHSLVKAQETDEHISTIKEVLRSKPYENYVMHNGLLCKEKDGYMLIVVPDLMQLNIIRRAHDQGHFKYAKLEAMISKEFFIPQLQSKVKDVCDNCVECILIEKKSGKQQGLLHPIPKEPLPLDTFHIDHLGPMTSTNRMYNHVLAIVDAFTKFVWLFPVKSTTAAETLRKLKMVTDVFGNPRRIITDKGSAFTSNDFREFCEEENIELVLCTTGVPRGNGQVERINRIVIAVLGKISIDNPDKWYVHLGDVQKFLNKSFQRSIKMTPFELMVGVTMKTKTDIKISEVIEEKIAKDFSSQRDLLRQTAKQQIDKITEENRRTYNSKRKEATKYQVGDLVSISRTQFGTGMKLRPKNYGPYRVAKVKGCDRYDVEKVGDHEGPGKTSSSYDNMKKWPSEGR